MVVGKSGVWICLARRDLKSSLRLNRFSAMASLGSSAQQRTASQHLQKGWIPTDNASSMRDACGQACMLLQSNCMRME